MIESELEKVTKYLKGTDNTFAPILDIPLSDENIVAIDLSKKNPQFKDIDIKEQENFSNLIFNEIKNAGAKVGVGGYLEDRFMYDQSENFNGDERRTIHLGIDLWAHEGTVVYAPLEGKVHSFNDNIGFGNYGPTIILEHAVDQLSFFTLYGHLSKASLENVKDGEKIKKGTILGRIGDADENGGWPPHLHFQIITDMEGNVGDFPGVAAPSKVNMYQKICPDPNLILRIKEKIEK